MGRGCLSPACLLSGLPHFISNLREKVHLDRSADQYRPVLNGFSGPNEYGRFEDRRLRCPSCIEAKGDLVFEAEASGLIALHLSKQKYACVHLKM